MLKKFVKHSFLYGFGSFLSQGVLFIMVPFYTRALTSKDIGVVDIITVVGALVKVTIALEVAQAIARFYNESHKKEVKIGYTSTAFWFSMCVYIMFSIIAWFFAKPISSLLFGATEYRNVFRIAVIYISLSGIFFFLQLQLRWQLKPVKNVSVNIIMTLISVSIIILLVLLFDMGVSGVFYGLAAGALIGSILAYKSAKEDFQFVFDFNKLKEMLSFSLPLVPSGLGIYLSLYVDRLAIKEFLTLGDVGIYGVGYRIASIVGISLIGFQGALTPLIYSNYKDEKTKAELARIFHFFLVGASTLFLVLSLFSKEMLIILTTPEYYSASGLIPFLVLAVLLSNIYIFVPGLSIAKKTNIVAVINIFTAVINIILNLLFVPVIGIMGAAMATLISTFMGVALNFKYGQKYYHIPYKWSKIGLAGMFVILITVLVSYLEFNFIIQLIIKLLLVPISIGVVGYLLVDRSDIGKLYLMIKSKVNLMH